DDATAIAVDSRGRLLVVGSTTGTWDASDPTADNSRRALVLSLDDVGTVVWARHIAAPKSSAYGLSIAVDSTDAVIVAGYTLGNVIPGGGLGAEDAFVSKFDSA